MNSDLVGAADGLGPQRCIEKRVCAGRRCPAYIMRLTPPPPRSCAPVPRSMRTVGERTVSKRLDWQVVRGVGDWVMEATGQW
jgi:hypothetical protein